MRHVPGAAGHCGSGDHRCSAVDSQVAADSVSPGIASDPDIRFSTGRPSQFAILISRVRLRSPVTDTKMIGRYSGYQMYWARLATTKSHWLRSRCQSAAANSRPMYCSIHSLQYRSRSCPQLARPQQLMSPRSSRTRLPRRPARSTPRRPGCRSLQRMPLRRAARLGHTDVGRCRARSRTVAGRKTTLVTQKLDDGAIVVDQR